MNEDFFDGDRKEEEEFQGYSEIEAGHSNNAPDQAFQQPQLSTAFSGEIDYAQPIQMQTQQEQDDALQKMRQEEDQLRQKLYLKAEEEQQLKKKRREKAAKELEQWQQARSKQVEASRTVQRQNSNKQKDKVQNYVEKGSWDKIADNVALKEGDYPGNKFVSRMRDCIVGKRDDELNKKQ